MKKFFILLPIVALLAASCNPKTATNTPNPGPPVLSVYELLANPQAYNNKNVKVHGVLVSGFEVTALGQGTYEKRGDINFITGIKQPAVWVAEATITNKQDCSQSTKGIPLATFCTADVLGIFHSAGGYGPAGTNYEFEIKNTTSSSDSGTASTGTIKSHDTATTTEGLALYPDDTLMTIPVTPVTVKYLIEHRSALNNMTVTAKGIIVGTIFGTDAQPSIIIADNNATTRDKNYDLRIGLNETDQNYTIGQSIVVKGIFDGSRVAVFMRKSY